MSEIIKNVSVDCVIFGFDGNNLNILLIDRILKDNDGVIHFKDHTLLGYHINREDNLDVAASSILYSLTGLSDVYLEQVFTSGDPDRLKRPRDQEWIESLGLDIDERTITIVYYSLIDTAKIKLSETNKNAERKAQWFPINDLPDMGFDHKELIEKTLEKLKEKALLEPIVFELLPEKFTISQLQRLYEAILGTTFDRRNFRKKLLQMRYIIPLNEKQQGVAHKPAQLFFFSREVYEKTRKEKYVISL